jgi:hypothetical protein
MRPAGAVPALSRLAEQMEELGPLGLPNPGPLQSVRTFHVGTFDLWPQ